MFKTNLLRVASAGGGCMRRRDVSGKDAAMRRATAILDRSINSSMSLSVVVLDEGGGNVCGDVRMNTDINTYTHALAHNTHIHAHTYLSPNTDTA